MNDDLQRDLHELPPLLDVPPDFYERVITQARRRRRAVRAAATGLTAAVVAIVVAITVSFSDVSSTARLVPITPPPPSAAGPTLSPSAVASSPGRSPTGSPSPTSPTASRSVAAGAVNLMATPQLRAQLLDAFAAAKGISRSDISQIVPGSLYYGYLPASGAYWALAQFTPSDQASEQTKVAFQDGAGLGIFTRRGDAAWTVTIGHIPFPCGGDLPSDLLSLWGLSLANGCP